MILDNFEQEFINDYMKVSWEETPTQIIHKYVMMEARQYNELMKDFHAQQVLNIDGHNVICTYTRGITLRGTYMQIEEIRYSKCLAPEERDWLLPKGGF